FVGAVVLVFVLGDAAAPMLARAAAQDVVSSVDRGKRAPATMLTRRIDLDVSDAPLTAVLEQLVRAGVPLVYSYDAMAGYGNVQCRCSGLTVAELLDRLLPARGIVYRETSGGEVVLSPAPKRAPVQTGTVRGRVIDGSGSGLPGVYVRILETNIS